jgi:iron complex outermembrane receptor protein
MGCGFGLAVFVGLVVPSASGAQAAKGKKAAAAGGVEIEEITVTAQKREESIQETPISVTALSSQALEQSSVKTVVDLGQMAPNLRITSNTGSTSSTTITLRGTNQANPEAALQPKVGLYVDGVYIAKIIGPNLDLEDIERVEVLHGPQGTLYGRNAIGGAVNFITKKPTEERAITLNTEVGNYETFNGRLTVNVPLIGKNGFWQSDAIGTLDWCVGCPGRNRMCGVRPHIARDGSMRKEESQGDAL